MYTLIQTAKLNSLDPQAWLADVLARIADHSVNRLDELLPWKWKLHAEAAQLSQSSLSANFWLLAMMQCCWRNSMASSRASLSARK